MRFICRILAPSAFAVASIVAPACWAQGYPSKPVRVIVPYAPAGVVDILARAVAQKLGESWKQQFVIENIAGANGIIGTELAAKAPKDGYSLLMIAGGNHVTNQALRKLAYDPVKDFTGVALVGSIYFVLSVHPSVPARDLKQLTALARAKPGQLNYGSTGSGSPTHLSAELFKTMQKLDIVHVPYKGAPQVLTALLSGEVALSFLVPTSALPQAASGKVRMLAVSGPKRLEAAPQLPTFPEAGLPGFEVDNWIGLLAPAGTTRSVVAQLNAEIGKIQQLPDIRSRASSLGITLAALGADELTATMAKDAVKWERIVKESGARVE